ncbi:MAG: hypothetical protein HC896_08510 [Bacteroidales bacterium]|nr:hypothetical protein [Bacteroidales bacterium]
MNKKEIDNKSIGYNLLRTYTKFIFRRYYKKYETHNAKSVKQNKPIIFALNHQNALMDALAVVHAVKSQPVFLARSDIFRNPVQAKILNFFKIMPIYRIRDGAENVKKNDEVFEKTMNVLRNKKSPLGIMPEGMHGDKRRLRPLVKGVFRIALLAQQEYGKTRKCSLCPLA